MSEKVIAENKKRNAKRRQKAKEKEKEKEKEKTGESNTVEKKSDSTIEKKSTLPTTILLPSTPKELKEFNLIIKFMEALSSCYKQDKKILFYKTLLEKMSSKHAEGIRRHLFIFNKFCEKNIDAIQERNVKKFVSASIEYSAKASVQIKELLTKETDKEIKETIWEHLTVLAYYSVKKSEEVNGAVGEKGESKEGSPSPSLRSTQLLSLLKDKESHKTSDEDDFVSGLIDKMSSGLSADQMSDPSSLIMSMMSNGMLSDIMGDAEDKMSKGKLNINKLLGSVQGLIGKLSVDDEKEEGKAVQNLNKKVEEIMNTK